MKTDKPCTRLRLTLNLKCDYQVYFAGAHAPISDTVYYFFIAQFWGYGAEETLQADFLKSALSSPMPYVRQKGYWVL